MTSATELIDRAIDLSDEEQYSEAIALLNRAISIDPSAAQAFFERGMAFFNLDQNVAAAADFDRALSLDTNFPGARDWRSRVAESLGDVHRAAEERLKELRAKPDGPHKGRGVSPQVWADCASTLMKVGEHDAARQLLDEYFDAYAQKVTSYACYETAPMRMLAKLLVDSGNTDEGLRYANRAYSSRHRVPADILAYALALEAASRWEEARTVCNEALAVNDQMPGLRELQLRLSQTANSKNRQ